MSTQTGSISFEATGGFQSYAKQNYATLSQIKGQFATCGTGAGTAAKVATIVPTDSGWELYTGATVTVKFTSSNTTTTPTLNVNGTGAKQIRDYAGNTLTEAAYKWADGAALALTYDGTYWRVQDTNLMETVHKAETAIEQNAEEIALKASASDTYTKSDVDGFIAKEVSDRDAAIQVSADNITSTVSSTYATKTALNDAKNEAIDAAAKALAADCPLVMGTQTAATYNWTGTCEELESLKNGQQIVYFLPYSVAGTQVSATYTTISSGTTTNTTGAALQLTLKNGSKTNNIPIWYGSGMGRVTSHYAYGAHITMTYRTDVTMSGTYKIAEGWFVDAEYNSDNVYSRSISGGFYTGKNGILSYGLCMRDENGRWTAITNNKYSITTQDKTCYTGELDPSEILYCSTWYTNGRVTTDNTSISGDLWASNIFDFRYCTNISANSTAGKGMTVRKPVYLVGTLGATGLMKLDSTQWWTQTEPTTEDGKIYIYLGIAYSWYQLALADRKPMYQFINGKFQESTLARITKAETKIDQTDEAITLTASRVDSLSIGNRNLLEGEAASVLDWTNTMPAAVTLSGKDYECLWHLNEGIDGWENVYSPAISVTSGETYTVSLDYSVESSYIPYGTGDQRMFGLEVCTSTASTSNNFSTQLAKIPFGTEAKERTRGSATFTATTDTIYLHLNGGYIKDGEKNKDFVVSRIKLEKGTTATAWMAPFSDYATNAKLEVTANGITSEVSKISSAKYVNTSYSQPLATIKSWAAEGYDAGNWNHASDDTIRVGDMVYFKLQDTTRNCPVYVKVKITSVTSATQCRGISHGYEDVLPVDTIKSTINQSSDSVTIKANHVDIEGAAIFSSGGKYDTSTTIVKTETQWYSSTSATTKSGGSWGTSQPAIAAGRYIWQRELVTYASGSTAYKPSAEGVCIQGQTDLSKYSTTDQMNAAIDNIEVGGRNLLLKTGTAQSKTMPAVAAGSYTTWDPYAMVGAYSTLGLAAGDYVTLSFDWSVAGAAANSTAKFGVNATPWEYFGVLMTFAAGASSGHVEKSFQATSALAACTGAFLRARIDAVGNAITTSMALTLKNVKLEKGNRATDWTPAPEDVEASIATKADITAAVAQEQRIYFRTNKALSGSLTGPTTWITEAGNKYNTAAPTTATTGWSTKVTPLATSTSATDKYLYLYTCTQTQTVAQAANNGTSCSASSVLLDDSDTIIDGGHIITGTIDANSINAQSIAGSSLTISNFKDSDNYLNSNIQVGGRNLLLYSKDMSLGYNQGSNYTKTVDGTYHDCTVWKLVKTTTSSYADFSVSNAQNMAVTDGEEDYILSFWAKAAANTTITSYFYNSSNNTNVKSETSTGVTSTNNGGDGTSYVIGTEWERYWVRWHFSDKTDPQYKKNLIVARMQASVTGTLWVAGIKLEKGNIATDWTAAPEDLENDISNLGDDINNIAQTWFANCTTAAGTAAKTATITPATDNFTLTPGATVNVKFTNTNSAAVNDLTLSVNGTTAKNIKYIYNNSIANIPAVGYLIAGGTYQFVYDGTYWQIQNMNYNTNTNDTALYTKFYNTIVAGEAIVAESIIGGRTDGKFYQIKENRSFDLSHPLLWTTTALAANATNYANIYTQCYDRNLGAYYTSFTNTTSNRMVYLVGTVNGNNFTTYGTNSNSYLTITQPTTENNLVYIPIGRLGNQSNGKNYFNYQVNIPVTLYAYLDGKFRQVTPTEVVGEQYIYIQATSGTNSINKNESWVIASDESVSSTVPAATGLTPHWTTKHPTYQKNYPVIFVAKQTKRLDGTVTCTTPVKDDTTTVIDGGHITTGTIDASKATITNINASNISTGTLNANLIAANSLSIGKLSDLNVGGTNLAKKTPGDTSNGSGYKGLRIALTENLVQGQKYVLQLWNASVSRSDKTTAVINPYWGGSSINLGSITLDANGYGKLAFTAPTTTASGYTNAFIELYNTVPVGASGTTYTMTVGKWKLEKGTVPTEWSQCPADVDSGISDAATKATSYITHVDNNGITIHPSSTTNNRVGINASGMTVYKGGYLKANFADTVTLYGGSNASGANPKVEITSSDFKMTDSGGTQRLLLNSSKGAVIGKETSGHVQVTDAGLFIYDNANKRRTQVDSSGLHVYNTDGSTETGLFGAATARIGTTAGPAFHMNESSLQAYHMNGSTRTKYFEVTPTAMTYGSNIVANTVQVTDAAKTANSFITPISDTEIKLHSKNNSTTNYAKLDSNGLEIFKQSASIAKFSEDIRIGKETSASRVQIDFNSFRMIDQEGSCYLFISDLRNANGTTWVWEKREYPTEYSSVVVHFIPALHQYPKVWVDGSPSTTTPYWSSFNNHTSYEVHFSPAGKNIVINYPVQEQKLKAYTFGTRRNETPEDESKPMCGGFSVAEGKDVSAWGHYSHAEGENTSARGNWSHAEGYNTIAEGLYCHAEGCQTSAGGRFAHAEGRNTIAQADHSPHAEGFNTIANGDYGSHSEGSDTLASGMGAHAEGTYTVAKGDYSHAQNRATVAAYDDQTVMGHYNKQEDGGLLIGNGTIGGPARNALRVDWNGAQYRTSNSTVYDASSAPASNTALGGNYYFDSKGVKIGYDEIIKNTSNDLYRSYAVRRVIKDEAVLNGIYLYIKKDGTRTVSVSDVTAWRDALKLGTLAQKSSVTFSVVNDSVTSSKGTLEAGGNLSCTCSHTTPSGYVGTSTGVVGISSNHTNIAVLNTFSTSSAKFRHVGGTNYTDFTCTHQIRYAKVTVS